MSHMNYYTQSAEDVVQSQKTDLKKGLSNSEVEARKASYGVNVLEEQKPPTLFSIFLKQFRDLFTIILFAAAGISFFVGEQTDSIIILVALLLNVIVSVIQENRAIKTIAELKEVVVFKAKALRDGEVRQINAQDLVPGDIIQLDAGDRIPADARVVEDIHFETKEALLTGESEPITKKSDVVHDELTPLAERTNMVYQSTVAVNGKARAVVVATGNDTEVGKIAALVDETEDEQTPLQRRLSRLSIFISVVVLIMSVLVLFAGVALGEELGLMFHFAVALAVSAIPEGMVLAVTVILAVGMRQILKRNAVVRELVAAETLGSTTVICSDKTGTMTTGEMVAERFITLKDDLSVEEFPKNVSEDAPLFWYSTLVAALSNDLIIEDAQDKRQKILGDTTERALYLFAQQAGCDKCDIEEKFPMVDEIPFDSYIKYMVSLHEFAQEGKQLVLMKGAAERVLDYSVSVQGENEIQELTGDIRNHFLQKNEALGRQGYRIIALAYKIVDADGFDLEEDEGKGSTFLSLIAIRDPIREGIKESIAETLAAGIDVKMITGDQKNTAQAIANEVGLIVNSEDEIIEGVEFEKIQSDEKLLNERVKHVKVFARVAPVHKLKIVEVLQGQGNVVAMTGDGVNDGPALKKADIGVAMGSGTEVAQQTSDMVLRDDNFKTIIAAVEEGRRIFDNIRKVVLYLLSDSFAEVIMVVGSLIMGLPVPILPAQILWINIVDDGLPGMSLAFDPIDDEAMDEPPRDKNEPVLNSEIRLIIVIIGIVSGIGNLMIFFWLYQFMDYDLERARTVVFASLAIDSLLYIFSVRSLRHTIFKEHVFSNKYLIGAVGIGFLLQMAAIYVPFLQPILKTVPLGLFEWGIVFASSAITIIVIEAIKAGYIAYNKRKRSQKSRLVN